MLILVQFQVIMKNRVKQKKQIRELLSCCCIRAGTLELVIQEKQEQLDESYIICHILFVVKNESIRIKHFFYFMYMYYYIFFSMMMIMMMLKIVYTVV